MIRISCKPSFFHDPVHHFSVHDAVDVAFAGEMIFAVLLWSKQQRHLSASNDYDQISGLGFLWY
jgi:hypothetical protein